jgi:hypothetical protein
MPQKSQRGLSPSKSRTSGFKGAKSAANKSRRTSTGNTKPPRLPDEKSVRPTTKSVAVKPAATSKIARTPPDPISIDRRKQIVD